VFRRPARRGWSQAVPSWAGRTCDFSEKPNGVEHERIPAADARFSAPRIAAVRPDSGTADCFNGRHAGLVTDAAPGRAGEHARSCSRTPAAVLVICSAACACVCRPDLFPVPVDTGSPPDGGAGPLYPRSPTVTACLAARADLRRHETNLQPIRLTGTLLSCPAQRSRPSRPLRATDPYGYVDAILAVDLRMASPSGVGLLRYALEDVEGRRL